MQLSVIHKQSLIILGKLNKIILPHTKRFRKCRGGGILGSYVQVSSQEPSGIM